MLARDHTTQAAGQRHDARDRTVRGLQHGVVVAVDRDIGVHIAVAGMHVQRDPDTAAQDFLVDAAAFIEQRHEGGAGKELLQGLQDLGLPRSAQAIVLHQREEAFAAVLDLHHVESGQPARPQRTHIGQQGQRLLHTVFEQFGTGDLAGVVALAQRQ